MALNVPVLPVTVGIIPGEMLQQLHVVSLEDASADLANALRREALEMLVEGQDDPTLALYTCADETEDRAAMMYRHATDVLRLGQFGKVRQSGGLSSFHIPRETINHPVWKEQYGRAQRGAYYCRLQRRERLALQHHARKAGAHLIIRPEFEFPQYGSTARIARLQTLVKALDAMDVSVEVANAPLLESGENVTIVGDWFMAISVSGTARGLRQTIFTRHAPTIRNRMELFDQEFEELLRSRPWPTGGPSRLGAVAFLRDLIEKLKANL
ncbi:MAG TPA: hypothetical protein VGF39_02545 [Stellaceae bacterium]